jgi:hypothetical protein
MLAEGSHEVTQDAQRQALASLAVRLGGAIDRAQAWHVSTGSIAMQDLQSEQMHGGHWIENPFAPGVIHGMTNGVDEVGAEKLGQITLDLLDSSQDTTSHTWPPVEVRRFDTHILTGG